LSAGDSVTTPAAPQASPPGQPPPPPPDAHLIALIVAALAAYGTAKALTGALKAPFKAAGISAAILSAVAALFASGPGEAVKGTGPAQRFTTRQNLLRRAQFFLAAARRVQQAVKAARSKDEPAMTAIRDALATEKRYLGLHVEASVQRVAAAAAVDGMAAKHGNLLSWNAVLDPRCTPECRAANGKSFHADRPPAIGYPGATHPNCRCYPGPPRPGAELLP
jgi:SPP1 gp7 family putative phage head morphogenesis protein